MEDYEETEINLVEAVDFIKSMIPGIDEQIIEQYLIEYQNVPQVIDILMENQEALKDASGQKRPKKETKKSNFGFSGSSDEYEEEEQNNDDIQNYFFSRENEEEHNNGEFFPDEYENVEDYYFQKQ